MAYCKCARNDIYGEVISSSMDEDEVLTVVLECVLCRRQWPRVGYESIYDEIGSVSEAHELLMRVDKTPLAYPQFAAY